VSTLRQECTIHPNTSGVLGSLFTIELLNHIWQFLRIRNLIAYGNTSGKNHIHMQDFVRRVTDDEIRPFFVNPQALQEILWRTRLIISGLVALVALLPYQLRSWDPQDIDIYTMHKSFSKMLNYVVAAGYGIVGERITPNPNYPIGGTIIEVVKLVNNEGRKLDIIISNCATSLTPIFEYYSSHVINC
jgi:hypothetical protein